MSGPHNAKASYGGKRIRGRTRGGTHCEGRTGPGQAGPSRSVGTQPPISQTGGQGAASPARLKPPTRRSRHSIAAVRRRNGWDLFDVAGGLWLPPSLTGMLTWKWRSRRMTWIVEEFCHVVASWSFGVIQGILHSLGFPVEPRLLIYYYICLFFILSTFVHSMKNVEGKDLMCRDTREVASRR